MIPSGSVTKRPLPSEKRPISAAVTNAHPDPFTLRLQRLATGDRAGADSLLSEVYDELRALAAAHLRRERVDHTLQPTALAHEAYLKLVGQHRVQWRDRSHFLAVAAQALRRILIDHARKRGASKRQRPVGQTGTDENAPVVTSETDLLALDEALTRLAQLNQRQSQVIEMRFFSGMQYDEVAEVLGVSENTVKNDWRLARAWLQVALEEGPER